MARFVRSSKFRHVFGTAAKRENCYDNLKITKSPHETNMCSVNGKFVAVVQEAQGGGSFLVFPLTKVGRFDINYPKVAGHKGPVLDVRWNPFNDNEIASCSEDCTVKIWHIPDEGLTDNLEKESCVRSMAKHSKKVGQIEWHPSAANVLASASSDLKIIIWNTESGEDLFTMEVHKDMIYCMSWNYDGSLLATTSKDKKLRIINPRKRVVIRDGQSHQGNKPSRVVFCGSTNKLYTTGFTRMSERQHAVWDADDISKSLHMENIDTGSGVLFPFWDEGTKMIYIAGKGDTQIRYFEITDAAPYCYFLSMYQSTASQRGLGLMPKRELNYMHCEVMRFFKLQHPKGMVEPISMTVPRKSEMFQDDIYPPTFSGLPAMTAEEWAGGENKEPRLVKFSQDGINEIEPKDATKRLKQRSSSSKESTPPREPETLEEYKVAFRELREENEQLRKKLGGL